METIALAASLLFTAGQTTERVVVAARDLARAFGLRVFVHPGWGALAVISQDQTVIEIVPASPLGVDMGKVAATMATLEQVRDGTLRVGAAHAALELTRRQAPASMSRFAIMAALGAAALGVIFGDADAASLALIAVSAGAGALLRRGLARLTANPFVQPLCASLVAGVIGVLSLHVALSGTQRLVALCPCMVLVPGPHILNGALDMARARVSLGLSRLAYAGLIVLMICAGLLLGLAIGGSPIPASGGAARVPLAADVIAAGIAVAAYGSFFSMPWQTLPFPIAVGMAAHAVRWVLIVIFGGSAEIGAFVACLLVGLIVSPASDRLNLPFAALGFSAVVSLMPGYFPFETAGDLLDIVTRKAASPDLLSDLVVNGATALLIVVAINFGLILPRLLIERLSHRTPPSGIASKSPRLREGT